METYKDDIESVLDIDYFQVQHMFDDLLHMEDEDGKPFLPAFYDTRNDY